MLSFDDFKHVVQNAPLVSIDFLLVNQGKLLVAKRLNEPARGYYFVPGGRIQKEESYSSAIERLSFQEFGVTLKQRDVSFFGLYQHLYNSSFVSPDISQHYIAIGIKVDVDFVGVLDLSDQHSEMIWVDHVDLNSFDLVHANVKEYINRTSATIFQVSDLF